MLLRNIVDDDDRALIRRWPSAWRELGANYGFATPRVESVKNLPQLKTGVASGAFGDFLRGMQPDDPDHKSTSGGDARVLPVLYQGDGQRFRPFMDAAPLLSETKWEGFPVEGPRTVLWLVKHFRQLNMTPTAWHRFWRSTLKLQATDPGVAEHECSAVPWTPPSHVIRLMSLR